MKKTIIILAIIIVILSYNKKDIVTIPKESIRFRIIAKSNSQKDQKIKKEILNQLKKNINQFHSVSNINDSRELIKKEIPSFHEIIENTLEDNNYHEDYSINYGNNYFPEKHYKNVIYPSGEYESLVITIGEGKGKNFWCVLFPPLCLVDENQKNIEYSSLIKEIIDKYF